jgi:4-amino-4-deoxy-L-arabinose transferase-like glycosyltransferase
MRVRASRVTARSGGGKTDGHVLTDFEPMHYIRKLGSWVLLAAVTAVTAGWGLGEVELNGHECYIALAARGITSPSEWLDDHLSEKPVPPATTFNRWMVPQCNGQSRLRKTPLAYWAAAGLVKMGLPIDEATVRLPSMIASVLTVLVIFGVGRRMIGTRAALMGALMLAASLGTLKWGRSARPELLLMLWMTAAMACFWTGMQAATGPKRAAWLMAGWAAMGLANLSKEFVPLFLVWPLLAYLAWRASVRHDSRPRLRLGVFLILALVGVVLVDLIRRAMQWWQIEAPVASTITYACLIGLPLLGYFVVSRPWGQLKLVLPTLLPGLVLMALLFVPWLVYLDKLFPATSGTLWQQVGQRGVGDEESKLRVPGFYLLNLIVLTLPWAIFLPGAVMAPLRGAKGVGCRGSRSPLGRRNHVFDVIGAQSVLLPERRGCEVPEGTVANHGTQCTELSDTHASQEPAEHADGLVYLLLWVVGLTLLFSAAAGKRPHYILPAVPALCILAGYAAEDVFFRHRWFSVGTARSIMFGYALLGVIVIGGAAFASQAASGGWISHTVTHLLKLAKDKASPSDVADTGRYFIVPTIVLTVVLLAAAVAMAKNKPALSFAGLVVAAVVLMFSLASRPELVNESPHAAQEVGWIQSRMQAKAPISFWGRNGSDESLVYYFGHDMPNAVQAREAMTARYGSQEGMSLWEAWMRQGGGRWLLVRARDAEEVKRMGYTMVDPNHKSPDADMDVILFQPPAKSR